MNLLCGLFLLATPPPDAVLASYAGGTVTQAEYADWLLASGQTDDPELRPARLEAIALAEALSTAALAARLDQRPATAERLSDVERGVLVDALRRHSDQSVVVGDAEVEAVLRAEDKERYKPRTVRLRNIFKRVAPGAPAAERAAVRERLEELRRRLLAGADFDELAYRESDSQTRFQGGLMGYVRPGVLHPDVDRIAFALAEGELSAVLESDAGFTLLRCDGIAPARVIPVDEARATIRQGLFTRATEARWTRLRAELTPGGAGVVDEAVFRARAAERARREGLDSTPAVRARLWWERARLLATEEMVRRVNRSLTPPTEAEIRARYEDGRTRYVQPPEVDVSVIQWRLDGADIREVFAGAETVLARLRDGATTFEQAARDASHHASAAGGGRLGYLAPGGLAALGPNVFRVVGELAPGQTSGLVQQDDSLWVVKLWDRRPERPLTLQEAAPRIEKELGDARIAQLQASLEAQARRDLGLVTHGLASGG